jgi:hypothetical protein
MSYTVTSDNFEGKVKGDSITEKELLESGLNIKALIAGEHLKDAKAPIKSAMEEETK